MSKGLLSATRETQVPGQAYAVGSTDKPSARKARARPRKAGNLTEAQVQQRTKASAGYGATFIAVELVIVMTGTESAWIHLVSVLPGLMMMMLGITAAAST